MTSLIQARLRKERVFYWKSFKQPLEQGHVFM